MMSIILEEIIALMLLLRIPSGTTIPLSSFYSYGSAAGDTLLPPSDDGSSPSISLPAPFLFFGTYYSTIFVNNNGDLSFNQSWSTFVPTQFPIPTYPLVAAYQADVYTRGNGSVWYRITQNATLLAKAANNIRSLTGTSVSLQWLFIATWDHVGECCAAIDKTNTFQAVLATDNIRSYAIFLYADGLIQWPSSGAQVGFNAGNNVNYMNVPGSRTPYILNITNSSNVGVGGQWVFLISHAVPSCGVINNYSEEALTLSDYVKCYDQPYSSSTTISDLAACNDTQIIFVGAKSSNSLTVFAIGAFGSPNVFTATYSTTTAYYDPGGAYWYRYISYSFGFANSSSVNLNSCDYGQAYPDCVSRLCWHLGSGGYRAGCTTGLNDDPTWRKVIYKGNNSFAMCYSDKDECALGISGCNQNCTNTNGSYVCSCYLGYQISSNSRTCMDIDECALRISECNLNCINTIGSYVCSCYLGYQITSNNRTCADTDECALGISGCNQNCTNTNGSYVCSCYLGYQMYSDNKTCADVDECALGISECNQICTNTIGSYTCSCYLGYRISANNKICLEILSGDAINLTSTTSIIGIIAAMCAFTIICSFVIVFIVYKCKAKRRVENQSPSNMTSGDLPDIYMSQCDAYELSNFKTSQPRHADCHDVIDSSNLYEIPSAAVTQKEEAIYEPTN